MKGIVILCALLAIGLYSYRTEGKLVTGSLSTNSEFVYLSKFCFDTSGVGQLRLDIGGGFELDNLELGIYDDEAGSWFSVYGVRFFKII